SRFLLLGAAGARAAARRAGGRRGGAGCAGARRAAAGRHVRSSRAWRSDRPCRAGRAFLVIRPFLRGDLAVAILVQRGERRQVAFALQLVLRKIAVLVLVERLELAVLAHARAAARVRSALLRVIGRQRKNGRQCEGSANNQRLFHVESPVQDG